MIFQLFTIIGIAVFILFAIIVQEAYAYLDAGTGSYIFQIVIAFVIGGLYAVKLFWMKIIFFFKNLFKKSNK